MKTAGQGLEPAPAEESARERILDAAFELFTENGFAATSTLEIATRAQVSKRDLYANFADKQAMLAACIAGPARRVGVPADLPTVGDRAALAQALIRLGAAVMLETCAPNVVAMFRLAIAEMPRSPEVAATLNRTGRQAVRTSVGRLVKQAQSLGLIASGDSAELAGQFLALLLRDTMLNLLLGVRETPSKPEARRRAEAATAAFLKLHSTAQLR